MKYLYGAAVQGIQNFIFQTNELKDIVGASELVENICTKQFANILRVTFENFKDLKDDSNAIVNAAGNIKYIFEDEIACRNVYKYFPKQIVEYAPGITISQAVEQYENDADFPMAVMNLEAKLRVQRNQPMNSTTIGLMGIQRSRKTNMPTVTIEDGEYLDDATFKKLYHNDRRKRTTRNLCRKSFGLPVEERNLALDTSDITGKNDWIAVIHIDGNGLGQIVQKVGTSKDDFKQFSQLLDEATTKSAQEAFMKTYTVEDNKRIPFRTIVLSGDDHTIICRADLALDYAKTFIERFEENTKSLADLLLKHNVFSEGAVKDRLTACAGIAYVKSSYPFSFAYELAEMLCSQAKKDAKDKETIREGKELPASCLMFHKIQDSFIESWEEISDRELCPSDVVSFEFGPYYLHAPERKRWTIKQLLDAAKKLETSDDNAGNAAKSGLRKWMSLLASSNTGMAKQKLKRLIEITQDKELATFIRSITKDDYIRTIDNKNVIVYPAYDILAIHTINNQETK